MKKVIALAVVALMAINVNAAPERKMLEEGKMWVYVYHHFEDSESQDGGDYKETTWLSYYYLKGDTVIDGRQYMKMYRDDERYNKEKYYGAFREDEEGRVYLYSEYDKKDLKMIDFGLDFDEPGIASPDTIIVEKIKVSGKLLRRYRYMNINPDGSMSDIGSPAVEGIGYRGAGLVHYLYEPQPDCICEYESLSYVSGNGIFFLASDFNAPKEIELTENEKQLIASNNDFAFNLFRKARDEESSIMSPLSITYALGMLNNGAEGKTQQEINQTLGFGTAGADAINAFCQKMLQEASTLDNKTKALISNTIFVNEGLGYQLQDGFVAKANEYYNAQPQNRDFADGETMDVINKWASDHTEGMIPEVLNEYTFNPGAVSYLLNALYFKGIWSDPFDIAETKEEAFGSGTPVPMMHKPYKDHTYTENDLYQAINLPYGNGAYQISIFLPREGKTIDEVLENLNGSNWQVKDHCEVDLKLPRFETDKTIGLVEIMSALGMPTAFSPDDAEFPYFCNVPVFIQNMFQVAKIKLDEQGTEAAAVTVIEMGGSSDIVQQAEFHANRPFFYIISEQSTGVIFFMGQYMGEVTANLSAPQRLSTQKDVLYNLQGQRLTTPPTKGIYIKNGRKVVIK